MIRSCSLNKSLNNENSMFNFVNKNKLNLKQKKCAKAQLSIIKAIETATKNPKRCHYVLVFAIMAGNFAFEFSNVLHSNCSVSVKKEATANESEEQTYANRITSIIIETTQKQQQLQTKALVLIIQIQ